MGYAEPRIVVRGESGGLEALTAHRRSCSRFYPQKASSYHITSAYLEALPYSKGVTNVAH